MAKPPPEGKATRFKKGWKGGPGRPGMPAEVKALRQLSREDLVDIAMMVFQGDVVALSELVKRATHEDPTQRPTPIQVLTAKCLIEAIKKGDATVLNSLLDRFFGRAPIAIQVQKVEEPGAASGTKSKEIVFETVVVNAASN